MNQTKRDFSQQNWDAALQAETEKLIRLAIWEDNETAGDLTSQALVPDGDIGEASVVSRENGIVAGLAAAETILRLVDPRLSWLGVRRDGDRVTPGDAVGKISGPVRTMLTAERLLLNLVGRLSGIATLAARYVEEVTGTGARIYDTRKTTLGWRRLEKYGVRCGGGFNHRTGLFDAVLIKDNHLAFAHEEGLTPAEAVRRGRDFITARFGQDGGTLPLVEVEVDSLDQLKNVLSENPDIVLLDNMTPGLLREAARIRNESGSDAELEASGGIHLETVRAAAESGVERISVGALTHSARSLDLGLDWD